MAEKYGEIPKKFTSKWWSYFWTYYKWWVIVPAVLIVAIACLLASIWKMERYDVTLTYAGPHFFPNNHVKQISGELGKLCDDVNNDGKKLLTLANMTISDKDFDLEYKSSLLMSLQFSLEEEEKYIFIIHKDFASRYLAQNAQGCRYAPVNEWFTGDVSAFETLSAHGNDYGILLDESDIFEKWNCDLNNHYLLIRKKPADNAELPSYNAAIKLANRLLEQK